LITEIFIKKPKKNLVLAGWFSFVLFLFLSYVIIQEVAKKLMLKEYKIYVNVINISN